jgi:hypothetical protein
MRLSKVRAGQQIGTVKIVSVKRRHAYAYITFTDGKITKTVTLHKSQSFQDRSTSMIYFIVTSVCIYHMTGIMIGFMWR